jgi:DNA-binding YbaB/EbfC family protein
MKRSPIVTMPNLDHLLEQADAMHAQLANMRNHLVEMKFTGTAAGGAVSVTMTATGHFESVRLDPEIVASAEATELEELLIAALNDVSSQLRETTEQRVNALTELFPELRQP